MITTRGFRDILHMARHKRPHNFSLQFDVPWQSKPLVKRRNRIAVSERIMPPDGAVAVPLDEDEVKRGGRALRQARARRGDRRASCSRSSTTSTSSGRRRSSRAILPDAFVSCSSEVVNIDPRIRALLQRGDERLYRPEDRALSATASSSACAPPASTPWCASCSPTAASRPSRTSSSGRSACCCRGRPAASSAAAGPASTAATSNDHHHRYRRHLGRYLASSRTASCASRTRATPRSPACRCWCR